MDIITVILILFLSVIIGALVATGIMWAIDRVRARRNKLQPLLGVVLPKEDESA